MIYDVFISCKSEDYEIAEEVYLYLKDNGFHVFLSSKELRRMKDSEYMNAISEALDSATILLCCRLLLQISKVNGLSLNGQHSSMNY